MVDCAIILAAGESRRMGERAQPKALLRLADGSFLSRHVDLLSSSGVARILVVVGKRSEDAFAPHESVGVEVVVSPYSAGVVGSALSLLCGLEAALGNDASANTLVMDADIVYERLLLSTVLEDSTGGSQLFTIGQTTGDTEEVRVYGRTRAEPVLIGKGLPPSIVKGLIPLGESLGIIRLDAHDAAYCREVIRWIASSSPAASGVDRGGSMSEHEDVWQYLFGLRRLGVRQLPAELLFSECDTPADYHHVRKTVFPAIEGRDRARSRSAVG